MAFNDRETAKRPVQNEVVAALDVGTTSVRCLIGLVEGGRVSVIGIGNQVSRGLRVGTIVDMGAAERDIGLAIRAAEQMADVSVREALVNISGGQPTSRTIDVEIPISGREISDSDVQRAIAQARQFQHGADQELIHCIAVGYVVDANHGIRDPRALFGEKLGVKVHTVTAGSSAVRNLATCVLRHRLDIESIVVSPYASGMAALAEDEKDKGCVLIDMGGGTTTMSIFVDGKCVYAGCVPVGGCHVTNDIARGLTTPVSHAERLKTSYGSAIASVADGRKIIKVPQVGEDEPALANRVPKSFLVGIIQPRLEEIFEMVRTRLEDSGMDRLVRRRVILTGGASQMPGIRELAQIILDKQVRLGNPVQISGLPDAAMGPSLSTALGLLIMAARRRAKF
jgi:cell division protein FtsA